MYYSDEYYYTDLFRAIGDKNNQGFRGHPVFSALLYVFCPMAAKWWLNGADPDIPYDPVWEAASDFGSGFTLKDSLINKGVPDLVEHVKKYIDVVTTYRNLNNYRSSELSPLFTGGKIEVTARTGYQASFDKHFGGDWRNVLRYARAWAFTIPDWRGDAKIQPGKSEYKFRPVSVAFSVPGLKKPVIEWPAWIWRVKTGLSVRIVLGMMVHDNTQDQLRFALAARSNGYFVDEIIDGKTKRTVVPWEVTPHVHSLDRLAGRAEPFKGVFEVEKLVSSVRDIASVAEKGACVPLGALERHKKCDHCGFRAMCYTKRNEITPLVYTSMHDDAAKFDRILA